MAKIFSLRDDIDGTTDETVKTHRFSLDGRTAEIDLTDSNFAKLEKYLARYFEKGVEKTRPLSTDGGESELNASIRAWAMSDGRWPNLSNRGRIPEDVREAFSKHIDSLRTTTTRQPETDAS